MIDLSESGLRAGLSRLALALYAKYSLPLVPHIVNGAPHCLTEERRGSEVTNLHFGELQSVGR